MRGAGGVGVILCTVGDCRHAAEDLEALARHQAAEHPGVAVIGPRAVADPRFWLTANLPPVRPRLPGGER